MYILPFLFTLMVASCIQPKCVASDPHNILTECSSDSRLISSQRVYLPYNRMSHVIFLVHTVRLIRQVTYSVVCIQLVGREREREREREFVLFSFPPPFNISFPLQLCTGSEGFQDLKAPRNSRQSAVKATMFVSPTNRPPLSPDNIPGSHSC